jgi:hypothetical protein
MKPKDKAKDLIKQYCLLSYKGKEFEFEYYKKCALIAVDEILDSVGTNYSVNYWQEVKQEIEKL